MFKGITDRITVVAEMYPKAITELEQIFNKPTVIYIDWQNVVHWQETVGCLFDSFPNVKKVRWYGGTLIGDTKSEQQITEVKRLNYDVSTKPVKMMQMSIDVSSIPEDSPAIIKSFLKKSLLKKLDIETITFLNRKLKVFNQQGILKIEEPKCNFDVEIGRHMLEDYLANEFENFILWSGDGDFKSSLKHLTDNGKTIHIFSVAGRVSPEISELKPPIYDIRKIKEFICWARELPEAVRSKEAAFLKAKEEADLNAKGTPEEAPQL